MLWHLPLNRYRPGTKHGFSVSGPLRGDFQTLLDFLHCPVGIVRETVRTDLICEGLRNRRTTDHNLDFRALEMLNNRLHVRHGRRE